MSWQENQSKAVTCITCCHSVSCDVTESMALEASARVAVTNAIENKEDLGGMLGMYPLCRCIACFIFSTCLGLTRRYLLGIT